MSQNFNEISAESMRNMCKEGLQMHQNEEVINYRKRENGENGTSRSSKKKKKLKEVKETVVRKITREMILDMASIHVSKPKSLQ